MPRAECPRSMEEHLTLRMRNAVTEIPAANEAAARSPALQITFVRIAARERGRAGRSEQPQMGGRVDTYSPPLLLRSNGAKSGSTNSTLASGDMKRSRE